MALSRAFLNGMGLTEEQVEAIVEAHVETVDFYKGNEAELKKELEEAKAALEAKPSADAGLEAELEKIKKEYADFKAETAEKEATNEKASLYRSLLREQGVAEKRIDKVLKVTDLQNIQVEGGKLVDAEKLAEDVKAEWSDFIPVQTVEGAKVETPPDTNPVEKDPFLEGFNS